MEVVVLLKEKYSYDELMGKDDLALLDIYHSGNQLACTIIITRYSCIINYLILNCTILGLDKDDLKQEANLALLDAINTFDKSKGCLFSTYANTCINNRLKNIYSKAITKKSVFNNSSLSLDEVDNFTGCYSFNDSNNPENIVINNENYDNLLELIENSLTSNEKDVLILFLNDFDYKTIARLLSSTTKSVDNSLQRARKKIKKVLNNL